MSDKPDQSDDAPLPDSREEEWPTSLESSSCRSGPQSSSDTGLQGRLNPNDQRPFLPQWLFRTRQGLSRIELFDSRFPQHFRRYIFQAALAAAATLVVLVVVDSLSDAAIAAGLGSSILILFVHPRSQAATHRSLLGGHSLALLVGSGFALLLFTAPGHDVLNSMRILYDMALAACLGLSILLMAVTNTEHPPAAGTVLGMASQPWDLQRVLILLAAVILLSMVKRLLDPHLGEL